MDHVDRRRQDKLCAGVCGVLIWTQALFFPTNHSAPRLMRSFHNHLHLFMTAGRLLVFNRAFIKEPTCKHWEIQTDPFACDRVLHRDSLNASSMFRSVVVVFEFPTFLLFCMLTIDLSLDSKVALHPQVLVRNLKLIDI